MRPLIALICGTGNAPKDKAQLRDFVNRAYSEALRCAGATPLLVPLVCDEADVRSIVSCTAGLLVTGGVDVGPSHYGEETMECCGAIDPLRDAVDQAAIAAAQELGLPILGICRGIQSLAVFTGGALFQDIPTQVEAALPHQQKRPRAEATHTVEVLEGTLLADIVGAGELPVNTFHHQATKGCPPGFRVTARATDGIVEALEHEDRDTFQLGVQWHPEEMAAAGGPHQALFNAFVEAARRRS